MITTLLNFFIWRLPFAHHFFFSRHRTHLADRAELRRLLMHIFAEKWFYFAVSISLFSDPFFLQTIQLAQLGRLGCWIVQHKKWGVQFCLAKYCGSSLLTCSWPRAGIFWSMGNGAGHLCTLIFLVKRACLVAQAMKKKAASLGVRFQQGFACFDAINKWSSQSRAVLKRCPALVAQQGNRGASRVGSRRVNSNRWSECLAARRRNSSLRSRRSICECRRCLGGQTRRLDPGGLAHAAGSDHFFLFRTFVLWKEMWRIFL